MKKFTSKSIYKSIEESNNESRKKWLLKTLKIENRVFWEEGYHGEELESMEFYNSKVNYIHMNPVRAGIVEKEEEYLNSSAGDFFGVRKRRFELIEYT